MKYIFDTSAIIALMLGEQGSDVVEKITVSSSGSCCIHSVNYVELYYKMGRIGGPDTAKFAVERLRRIKISVTDISGYAFLHRVGEIKNLFPALSLGDCYAIGLSEWLKGVVVTSDRHFSKASALTKVKQIR